MTIGDIMKRLSLISLVFITLKLSCDFTNQKAMCFFKNEIYPILKKTRSERQKILVGEWRELVEKLNFFIYHHLIFAEQIGLARQDALKVIFLKNFYHSTINCFDIFDDIKKNVYYYEEVIRGLIRLLIENNPVTRRFIFNKILISQWLGEVLKLNGVASKGLILFDINAKRFDGGTPLMFAAYLESDELVRALLELGVDKNAKILEGSLANIANAEYFARVVCNNIKITNIIKGF